MLQPVTCPFPSPVTLSLGGLFVGWLVYRDFKVGATDPLEKWLGPVYPVLKNKYYFDELYDKIFIKPAIWFSKNISYLWMDRKMIDGVLHWVARVTVVIGDFFRNKIDLPIINGFGDFVGYGGKKLGNKIRVVQTGRVQQYMLMGLAFVFVAVFYYIYKVMFP